MAVRRFEIKMVPERHRDLEALAAALDTTSSELARMGIVWILANRDLLLRGKPPTDGQLGAAA